MDKRIILAVAGAGKTTFIVNSLNLNERFLIITYTKSNYTSMHNSILKKFDFFPKNIELFTYFSFLYSFCFAPFLSYKYKGQGIYWDNPPESTKTLYRTNPKYYKAHDGRFYHNRLAEFIINQDIILQINNRLEKYYDHLFVDEVQDFAGYDFDLLESIILASIDILFVGDFYQHTYDTSRDGNRNKNLHKNYDSYITRFKKNGLVVDTTSLDKSYRCSSQICNFINSQLKIKIESHRSESTCIYNIKNKESAKKIFEDDSIIKLFYMNSKKYNGFTKNWGDCKGENCYNDVCVILNKKSYELYIKGKLKESAQLTKNKLYVAFSRTRNNLYIIPYSLIPSINNK